MSQLRTLDYGAPRKTRLLNSWFLNIIPSRRVYSGFAVHAQSTPSLNLDLVAGILISQDGVVIEETGDLVGVLAVDPDLSYPRIDLVVARHTYGTINTPQTYEVIKGEAGNPPAPPALPDHCIPLAEVYVQAGATEILEHFINPCLYYTNSLSTQNLMRSQFAELRPESMVRHGGVGSQIWINAGTFVKSDGTGVFNFTGQATPGFDSVTDPTHERIDIVTITDTGYVEIIKGAEALIGSAAPPDYPTDRQVVAEVVISGASYEVLVNESDIHDVRFFFNLGGGGGGGGIGNEIYRMDIIAAADQTVVPLSFNYNPGHNELFTYSSGMMMSVGSDYTETNSSTITFATPRVVGEYITVIKVGLSINSLVAPVSLYEVYSASASQTDFTLTGTYRVGTDELLVFRNGKRLEVGNEYLEISPQTVSLINPCVAGDRVIFQTMGATKMVDKGVSTILSKLVLGSDVIAPDTRVRIESGAIVGTDDDTATIEVTANLIVDILKTGGPGAGGLDSGTPSPNNWYAIWLIKNASNGVVDGLFSLSFYNPVMPAGYTLKRRIGAVYYMTDGASDRFRHFRQCMNHVSIQDKNKRALHSGTVSVRTWRTISLATFVPPTFKEVDLEASLCADDLEIRIHSNNTEALPSTGMTTLLDDNIGTVIAMISTNGAISFASANHISGFALPTTNLYWYVNNHGSTYSLTEFNIGVTGYADLL